MTPGRVYHAALDKSRELADISRRGYIPDPPLAARARFARRGNAFLLCRDHCGSYRPRPRFQTSCRAYFVDSWEWENSLFGFTAAPESPGMLHRAAGSLSADLRSPLESEIFRRGRMPWFILLRAGISRGDAARFAPV